MMRRPAEIARQAKLESFCRLTGGTRAVRKRRGHSFQLVDMSPAMGNIRIFVSTAKIAATILLCTVRAAPA
jgi:hypothetical protein